MKSASGLSSRLLRISLGSLAIAFGVVLLAVLIGSFVVGVFNVERTARAQALVLADNLAAAVAFEDRKAASALLQTLERAPSVLTAQVRNGDGSLLTLYSRHGDAWHDPASGANGSSKVLLDRIQLQQPVRLDGRTIGQFALVIDLTGMYERLAGLAAVLVLVCSLVLVVVARRIRTLNLTALAPLAELNAVMVRVAEDGSAAQRAGLSGIPDFDALALRFNDMIEQIQLRDARLASQRDALEHIVVARTEQLHRAKDVAEAASAAKSEFLATMSHEIRTPMNGVLGMNELLVASELQPQQRLWAEAVQSSGRHLLGILNDILDFSRLESGQVSLQEADFDLAAVVDETLSLHAQAADAKGVELAAQFIPPDARLLMRGDAFRMRQVLMNLIGNAVKFTPSGEVVVRVIQREPLAGQPSITVSVQDSGIGIAAEAQARIFDHFSQADGSTTRDFGGSGLGLAISQRLVRLMGGSIRVHSQLGHGASFSIDLSLPPADAASDASLPAVATGGQRALVVDDNATARDTLSLSLGSMGLAVTGSDDGAKAMRLMLDAAAQGRPYDLVLLDTQMPGMDGLQLGQAIRAQPVLAATKLVYALSTTTEIDPQALLGAAVQCVQKPIHRAALRQAVRTALVAGASAPAPEVVATAPAGLQGKVLLVEDNPINQRVGTMLLQKLGLQYVLAENGAQALEWLREERFDLVLMDCQMPVMDGYQATAAIRRLPGHGADRLPIVALTANVIRGDEQRCLDVGMNAFLGKPYSLSALRAVIAPWLPPASGGTTSASRLVGQPADQVAV